MHIIRFRRNRRCGSCGIWRDRPQTRPCSTDGLLGTCTGATCTVIVFWRRLQHRRVTEPTSERRDTGHANCTSSRPTTPTGGDTVALKSCTLRSLSWTVRRRAVTGRITGGRRARPAWRPTDTNAPRSPPGRRRRRRRRRRGRQRRRRRGGAAARGTATGGGGGKRAGKANIAGRRGSERGGGRRRAARRTATPPEGTCPGNGTGSRRETARPRTWQNRTGRRGRTGRPRMRRTQRRALRTELGEHWAASSLGVLLTWRKAGDPCVWTQWKYLCDSVLLAFPGLVLHAASEIWRDSAV
ncbi:hypothetical protein MATL_G00123700 [Megalops atlanticus]|uniref:Uncharacterized protein n=1 Tax=Megalops atlanticus TaxID=7932 RepID=A0A9D3Q081_MEGAT|nr:hypothetical protein MATL_G00123700 [Megalops atlanticus]